MHTALAYPSGRLTSRFERVVVTVTYVSQIALALAVVVTWSPRAEGCRHCVWTPAIWPNPSAQGTINAASNVTTIVLAALVLACVRQRYQRSSPAQRRELIPLWVAVGLLAAAYVIGAFASSNPFDAFTYLLDQVKATLRICIPLIFLAGLLWSTRARSAVGTVVLDLDRTLAHGQLQSVLARALGDPSLHIMYAVPGGRGWVDASGSEASVPESTSAGRDVTLVQRDGRPYAALIHRSGVNGEVLQGITTAAGMALENEALHAAIAAQLTEVRESRSRIVAATDLARRQVERDLHDGAQQRLLTVALAMQQARREILAGNAAAATTLRQGADELAQAFVELRELARGIYPAVLSDEGLGAALRSLADRSTVAVVVDAGPQRYPEPVEATAYFVVNEAVTNAAKHAAATHVSVRVTDVGRLLRVEIVDDGAGGADPALGSGLRGLSDRVAAVGGSFSLVSSPGGGTAIQLVLPLDGGVS